MRRKKYGLRIATVALGLAMAFSMNVSKVQAAPENELVQQKELTNYGLTADLTISSIREMNEFATKVANGNSYEGKTVVLTNDLVYDGRVGNFTPISGFRGTFDGQGHSISGIYVKTNSSQYAALFTSLGSSAVVQNVIVKDSVFYVETEGYNNSHSAGIVAENGGTIANCGVMNTTIDSIGDGDIEQYGKYPNNKYKNYGYTYAGSISAKNSGKIINSYSWLNTISAKGYCSSSTLTGYAGGICGSNSGIIQNSCNISNVLGNYEVGGIAGYSTSIIRNCYNAGNISLKEESKQQYIGGIVGYSEGNVLYCYTSEEAAPLNFGSMTGLEEGNKAMKASDMQTISFLNQLNADLSYSTDWIPWEFRSESVYPLPKKAINISDCTFSVAGNCVYNGEEQKPGVAVNYNGTTLTQDVHYSVTYSDNENAGTGSVTITGIGIYSGTEKIPFTINKAPHKFKYTPSYTKEYTSYSYGRSFELDDECIQGNGKVTYSSSNEKIATVDSYGNVEYHKVGKVTITISAEETDNYSATQINITLTVKPQKQTIVSSKVSSGKMKIKWVKDTEVTGYELQYARNKKFTKNLKTVKIKKKKKINYTSKKLTKKKTYYVRVRSYKGNIYGDWSKVVKVRRNK